MNTKNTLIAGASLVLAAALISIRSTPAPIDPMAGATQAGISRLRASSQGPREMAPTSRASRPAEPGETANLSEWQKRLDELIRQHGDRECAVQALLSDLAATYDGWVREQAIALSHQPTVDRCEELMRIAISVNEGVTAILDSLGIEMGRLSSVTAAPLETLAAEIQYGEMAPNPESRVARMRLDRERQARLEQTLALTDAVAQSQAMNELDAWYASQLGSISMPRLDE